MSPGSAVFGWVRWKNGRASSRRPSNHNSWAYRKSKTGSSGCWRRIASRSAQVVRVVGDIGAVQLDGTEASRRPSRLQGHAGVNCVHGVSVFSEREESLRE